MSTSIGLQAEAVAADWLKEQGYEVLEKNWRTRWCEVDIIASSEGVVYFVEVKYRRQPSSGEGLNYVTTKKLKQMKFAAEMWLNYQNDEFECELSAISLSGQPPMVDEFITQLT